MSGNERGDGRARYVFRVAFRLEPAGEHVSVDPAEFETTLHREADPPGRDGWLFFRDNLWRGEIGDRDHFRGLTEEVLGAPVTSVSFSELQTDGAYLDALRAEIEANLAEFKADDADEVLSKYLGSSIRVVPDGQ